ncbi:hypothetical protein DRH29_04945 [candidate division Kazan bacterium]|uniref:Uncharacterized protein n=1 Tax=candidate division Kazan bacterium TaxID=2202143 RepID=A0A420ZBI2_UNCK3|nr:MAG: hypothetical protein DRH29_04945 [candidate division Kazan bacterium]
MSLYNQDGRDYSSPVKWEPPPPQPRRGSSWEGSSLLICCLVIIIGWLLWDKFTHQPIPAPTTDIHVTPVNEMPAQFSTEPAQPIYPEPSSASESFVEDTSLPDFSFHLRPLNAVSFYCSQEAEATAIVEGLATYHVKWTVKPRLHQLYLSPLDTITRSVRISATEPLYYSNDPSMDGENAIQVDLYDHAGGKLLDTCWLDVNAMNPLDVDLPGYARMSPSPLPPTVIVPSIEWEGDSIPIFPYHRSRTHIPDGMVFEWRWEKGELAGTDAIFAIPGDFFYKDQTLLLTVSYRGFSDRDEMQIN